MNHPFAPSVPSRSPRGPGLALLVALFVALLAALLPATAAGAAAAPAADDPLFTSFQSAKAALKQGRPADADTALRRVAELLADPSREAERPKILPAFHFYSALVAFQLGDSNKSAVALSRYLELQPEASLDPSAFPKDFVRFFEATKAKELKPPGASPPAGPQTIGGTALPPYASRELDALAVPPNDGSPSWPDGAVSVLLTDAERATYRTLPDDASRREWVARFWRPFDPPGAPAGTFQAEFYRRAQYCDATFSTELTRGSLSDRGRVFLVLGPPTYASRQQVRQKDDPIDRMRMANGFPTAPGQTDGDLEVWAYRQPRIPDGIPYTELKYQFVTRTGYGTGVLQKEPREMNALQMAARLLRREASSPP